jgi:DNA phosphorothioation-associated putative methyltransferase
VIAVPLRLKQAGLRLQGLHLPRFSVLREETQADILSIWPSFKAAKQDGEAFLFSLGDPERVRSAAKSSRVGKLVGDFILCPPIHRGAVAAAQQVLGNVEHDVVKLSYDGRKVSFLRYPHFDVEAHPSLAYSLAVYLPKREHSYREFTHSENPPILHRKDTLVDETYPLYHKFLSLTRQEKNTRSSVGQILVKSLTGSEHSQQPD